MGIYFYTALASGKVSIWTKKFKIKKHMNLKSMDENCQEIDYSNCLELDNLRDLLKTDYPETKIVKSSNEDLFFSHNLV